MPSSVAGSEIIDGGRRRLEDLYLGLRTIEGLPADLVPRSVLDKWVELDWARTAGPPDRPTAILTAEGWLRLDALVAQIA